MLINSSLPNYDLFSSWFIIYVFICIDWGVIFSTDIAALQFQ